MTDRLKGYVVILEENIREDDAERITQALAMVKGVLGVQPLVADTSDMIIRERVRSEIQRRLLDVLR